MKKPIDPYLAVRDRAKVVARTAQGDPQGWGRVIAYSVVPTLTIERPDGTRFEWRHDMVFEAPRWELLFGIDHDFTGGKPVGEFLEESRGEA